MGKKQLTERQRVLQQARREWMGKWVQFDPGDGTGRQLGVVSLINGSGEIYVSYDFDEEGCFTLPVSTIEEAHRDLELVASH